MAGRKQSTVCCFSRMGCMSLALLWGIIWHKDVMRLVGTHTCQTIVLGACFSRDCIGVLNTIFVGIWQLRLMQSSGGCCIVFSWAALSISDALSGGKRRCMLGFGCLQVMIAFAQLPHMHRSYFQAHARRCASYCSASCSVRWKFSYSGASRVLLSA